MAAFRERIASSCDCEEFNNGYKEIFFEGINYKVRKGAQLDVACTSHCNASCAFCYAKINYISEGSYLNPAEIMIDRLLRFCAEGEIKQISFTGGEPTLNPTGLLKIYENTAPFFPKRKLATNGMRLFEKVTGNQLLIDALVSRGLNLVNFSLAHFDRDKNQKIMQYASGSRHPKIESLKHLASLESEDFLPLLSCYMHPEGVYNTEEMLRYVEFAKQIGFSRVVFRAGSSIPFTGRKEGETARLNDRVFLEKDIHHLSESIEKRGFFLAGGKHTAKEHAHYLQDSDGFEIAIRQSRKIPKASTENNFRIVDRIILMPDGIPRTSWIDGSQFLFGESSESPIKQTREAIASLG